MHEGKKLQKGPEEAPKDNRHFQFVSFDRSVNRHVLCYGLEKNKKYFVT